MKSLKRKYVIENNQDVLTYANMAVSTIKWIAAIFMTLVTLVIGLVAFLGYGNLSDLEKEIENKKLIIEEKANEIELKAELITNLIDTINVSMSNTKKIIRQIDVLSKNYSEYGEELRKNKGLTDELKSNIEQFEDKIDNISSSLKDVSSIFNRVAVSHQKILSPREKILLYLLAEAIDENRPTDEQNPTIASNVAYMWQTIGQVGLAYKKYKSIEHLKHKLSDLAKKNFDYNLKYCKEILVNSVEDTTILDIPNQFFTIHLPNKTFNKEELLFQVAKVIYLRGYLAANEKNILKKIVEE